MPNVYGERQNIANRYRNVFAIFMNNARRGLSMPRSATAADAGVL